jgi:heme/copper-type cytochrome/quinol oxidase subunit 3
VQGTVARPAARTRTPPPVFGMVLFLASELMFFGGLFASYFALRSNTDPWPPSDVKLDLPLTVVATVLLTVSSLTMHAGVRGARRSRASSLRGWVAVTFLLGAAFLGIKGYEFATADFTVTSHAYGSLWWTMLGAHGAHLAVGLVLLLVVVARLRRRPIGRRPSEPDADPLVVPETVGYYWHFVDVVWLGIFSTVYLIR